MEINSSILDSIVRIPSLRERLTAGGDVDRNDLSEVLEGSELKTQLPKSRQLEIIQELTSDLSDLVMLQGDLEKPIDLDKAQWATIATAPPIVMRGQTMQETIDIVNKLKALGLSYSQTGNDVYVYGYRGSFAFYKKPCHYKKVERDGCRFCALSTENLAISNQITTRQQLNALEDGIKKIKESGGGLTTFEILPDGSFFNDNEVSPEVQEGIMRRLAQEKSIFRISVETRPEFLKAENVRRLIKNLRPDQKLNIYFGLETTDEFVSSVIYNKGYGFDEFKKAVVKLKKEMTPEEIQRVELTVYNIIKPSFLSEKEAVEIALQTAMDVQNFAEEQGINIDIKYEPAVVSKGTLQEKQFNENRYLPPSYFTVCEILAQLAEKGLHKVAKFGQRDDIDHYSAVAKVPALDNPNHFSQYDFLVYNAVQRFNTTRDVRTFILDLRVAIQKSREFKNWEIEMYGEEGKSSLSKLLTQELTKGGLNDEELKRENFQRLLWDLADRVEYGAEFSETARTYEHSAIEMLKYQIRELFENKGITVYKVDNFKKIKDKKGFAYQLEVIVMNESGFPQNLWLKVPFNTLEKPEDSEDIFS